MPTKKTSHKSSRIGAEIVRRLKNFSEALESTDKLNHRFTCRTVKLNLPARELGPDDVRRVRSVLGASQAIFAQFIGVSLGAVRGWEQGTKPPGGAARRLMDEIERNPAYFIERMREMASVD